MIRRGALAGLALLTAASGAHANGLCDHIDALTLEAQSNFAERPMTDTFSAGLPGEETCTLLLRLGGARAINCQWSFAFRDQDARETFGDLSDRIAACPATTTLLERDQQVNHPDTYDLRKFDRDGVIIDVSLKDKGALQQTFVFLRIAADAR